MRQGERNEAVRAGAQNPVAAANAERFPKPGIQQKHVTAPGAGNGNGPDPVLPGHVFGNAKDAAVTFQDGQRLALAFISPETGSDIRAGYGQDAVAGEQAAIIHTPCERLQQDALDFTGQGFRPVRFALQNIDFSSETFRKRNYKNSSLKLF